MNSEQKKKQLDDLARLDKFMRANPDWMGIELDPDAPIPDILLAAKLPLKAHVDPAMLEELLKKGEL